MGVPQLRQEVLDLCDVVQAILAFNYQFSDEAREDLKTIRAVTPRAHAKQLRDFRDHLREHVKTAARSFGLILKPESFAKWFKENYRGSLGTLQLPKWIIEKEFFKNFGGDTEAWRKFPNHAHIQLDFEGSFPAGRPEYWIPEAVLYEDMCASYNLAFASVGVLRKTPVDKIETKQHYMHLRTAVLSAFYFVEAYLNGLAFDYWFDNRATLSADESDLLLEWNSAKSAAKWRDFRTKALQYPKMILGRVHPPITESNSANLALLLTDAKQIRDSIVHQTPKLEGDNVSEKTRLLVELRLPDVTKVVDSAVGFVNELNPLLGKYSITLDWLLARSKEGSFPKESFQ